MSPETEEYSSHAGRTQTKTFWCPDRKSFMGPPVLKGSVRQKPEHQQYLVCQLVQTNSLRGQKALNFSFWERAQVMWRVFVCVTVTAVALVHSRSSTKRNLQPLLQVLLLPPQISGPLAGRVPRNEMPVPLRRSDTSYFFRELSGCRQRCGIVTRQRTE